MKLTEKQRRFADEYVKTGNATQSAITAGYSKKTAQQTGSENLLKPVIKQYIDKRLAELKSKRTMDITEAIELLTSIARGEVKETVIVATATGAVETKKEADVKTRIQALKELIKRYPQSDQLVEQQLRKLKAEADIAEANARMLGEGGGNVNISIDGFSDVGDDHA